MELKTAAPKKKEQVNKRKRKKNKSKKKKNLPVTVLNPKAKIDAVN